MQSTLIRSHLIPHAEKHKLNSSALSVSMCIAYKNLVVFIQAASDGDVCLFWAHWRRLAARMRGAKQEQRLRQGRFSPKVFNYYNKSWGTAWASTPGSSAKSARLTLPKCAHRGRQRMYLGSVSKCSARRTIYLYRNFSTGICERTERGEKLWGCRAQFSFSVCVWVRQLAKRPRLISIKSWLAIDVIDAGPAGSTFSQFVARW